ncbi:uncharacterized protein LOC141728619 [Zonotrichia albicollis]|uniref:uncharacterized protein LOC141728619 n=1 Tax=Zonotrichia albicollis TaxID=44394 RepID=UPI003D812273
MRGRAAPPPPPPPPAPAAPPRPPRGGGKAPASPLRPHAAGREAPTTAAAAAVASLRAARWCPGFALPGKGHPRAVRVRGVCVCVRGAAGRGSGGALPPRLAPSLSLRFRALLSPAAPSFLPSLLPSRGHTRQPPPPNALQPNMAAAAGGSRRRAPPQRGEPSPGPPLLMGLRGGGDAAAVAAAGNAGIRADPGIREGERAEAGRPQRSSPPAAAARAGISRADPPVRPGIPAGFASSRGERSPPLPGPVPLLPPRQ